MSAPIIAEVLASAVARNRDRPISPAVRETFERLLIDVAGLCVAARNTESAETSR